MLKVRWLSLNCTPQFVAAEVEKFFSKDFGSYQFFYSTTEQEALALVWALKHSDV